MGDPKGREEKRKKLKKTPLKIEKKKKKTQKTPPKIEKKKKKKPDVAWPATLVWALAAIAVAHGDDARIRVAALVCMGVAAAATAAAVRVARQRKGAVPLASANAPAATTA